MKLYAVNNDIKGQSNQIPVLMWGCSCFACRIAERGLSLGGSDGGVSSVLLLFTFSYFRGELWGYKCILRARGDNIEFFLPLRYGKIIWKLFFCPINAFANAISHDFFSTVHTFPIINLNISGSFLELVLLGASGTSCYSWTAQVWFFFFFLRNQITVVHSYHVKMGFM